ncbi:MAG: hypothetical protein VKN72_03835 [Nostocales cyanobacterium 94392]|nr:hypothetical protein [Nostocales cyanobacterium 94392]
MISHNQPDENRGRTTPKFLDEQFHPVDNVCDTHTTIWELGLQGGKELASYYLDLVKISLQQQDINLSTQVSGLKKLRERLEIEEYTKKLQKER